MQDAYSMIQESDTWLMIIEEGEDRARRKDIVIVGEARLGPAPEEPRPVGCYHRQGTSRAHPSLRGHGQKLAAGTWHALNERRSARMIFAFSEFPDLRQRPLMKRSDSSIVKFTPSPIMAPFAGNPRILEGTHFSA